MKKTFFTNPKTYVKPFTLTTFQKPTLIKKSAFAGQVRSKTQKYTTFTETSMKKNIFY